MHLLISFANKIWQKQEPAVVNLIQPSISRNGVQRWPCGRMLETGFCFDFVDESYKRLLYNTRKKEIDVFFLSPVDLW